MWQVVHIMICEGKTSLTESNESPIQCKTQLFAHSSISPGIMYSTIFNSKLDELDLIILLV